VKEFIAWVLLGIAAIGGLYAIALMVYFFSLPKDANDDDCCSCRECEF
jgi:hypothetical protein